MCENVPMFSVGSYFQNLWIMSRRPHPEVPPTRVIPQESRDQPPTQELKAKAPQHL